jgi:hypothetical protein
MVVGIAVDHQMSIISMSWIDIEVKTLWPLAGMCGLGPAYKDRQQYQIGSSLTPSWT